MKNVTCAALLGDEAEVLAAFESGWEEGRCGGDDWASYCEDLQTRARARIRDAARR
jgi:membrane protein implicated in regulation of membrane protease activity